MNDVQTIAQAHAPPPAQRTDRPGGDGVPVSYEESLQHMKKHVARLAARFRVDPADVRQTLYLVWQRVALLGGRTPTGSRDAFYKYLYRALENELTDTVGTHPESGGTLEDRAASVLDADGGGSSDGADEPASLSVPAVDDQIRAIVVRGCTEAAFPEAVRTHPLYAHPACRTVLDGVMNQEPVDSIARRLGVTRRRVNAQIETLGRLFAQPDAAEIDRIFRALPEQQWLPGAPLTRRSIDSLRCPPSRDRAGPRVLSTLRRFAELGTQPEIVYVDQYSRVLSGADTCAAARILGVSSVATLLQVSRSSSPDMDDEVYRKACREPDPDAAPVFDLITAFLTLYEEGCLSGVVAAFLHQLGKSAQYTLLRELGTVMVRLLGAREGRALLKAAREGTFAAEVAALRARMRDRVGPRQQAVE